MNDLKTPKHGDEGRGSTHYNCSKHVGDCCACKPKDDCFWGTSTEILKPIASVEVVTTEDKDGNVLSVKANGVEMKPESPMPPKDTQEPPFWWKYTDGDPKTGEHWIPEAYVEPLLAESEKRARKATIEEGIATIEAGILVSKDASHNIGLEHARLLLSKMRGE